jgi:hypothetical protein
MLKSSGSWLSLFKEVDDAVFQNVNVYNKENHNNDGLNFDGCKGVIIRNCNLQTLDDSICFKSSSERITENVLIENCTISSYWAAVKFGTSSMSGYKNVTIRNSQFFNCLYGALKLMVVDGGIMEDITIDNIKMYNVGGPLFIRLGNRGLSYKNTMSQTYQVNAKPQGRPVGYIKNIKISNIDAFLAPLSEAASGVFISGIPGYPIENVTLENIKLNFPGGGTKEHAGNIVAEDIAGYPEQKFFGIAPAYGFFIRHVKGITVNNITTTTREKDVRPAFYLDDVDGFKLMQSNLYSDSEAPALITLHQVKNATISQIKITGNVSVFAKIKGEQSQNINFKDNNLKTPKKEILIGNGVKKEAVIINN